jgi:hypothetical protein
MSGTKDTKMSATPTNLLAAALVKPSRAALKEHPDCSICREALVSSDIVTTGCKHMYHVECLAEWVTTWEKSSAPLDGHGPTCPMCRQALSGEVASLTPWLVKEVLMPFMAEGRDGYPRVVYASMVGGVMRWWEIKKGRSAPTESGWSKVQMRWWKGDLILSMYGSNNWQMWRDFIRLAGI